MSFQDSAVIFFIALLLFGPKKLPELARQLGKLMGEFRRASNEFRMQLEDELRTSEQADKQKQIAALEAAAPPPDLTATPPTSQPDPLSQTDPLPEAPTPPDHTIAPPIASNGDLHLRAPETGLPIARGAAQASVNDAFNSLPELTPAVPELPPDRHTVTLQEASPESHA